MANVYESDTKGRFICFAGSLHYIKVYYNTSSIDCGSREIIYSYSFVLLPGMGVGLPAADFAPLMRRLSEKYTVVSIEYFGVGFSSETSKPRTSENYVEEIRTVLSKASFKAPYVLMTHSISSVYSEYYEAKYPKEVEAMISLDSTSTAFYAEIPAIVKSILRILKIQQAVGILSIIALLTAKRKQLLTNGYKEKEISDIITFASFSINDNVLEQIASSSEFIKQTMNLPFPKFIPYFKVISKKNYETPNKQLKMTPEEYQYKHLERIGKHVKHEILDGTHFIYANNVDRIAEITDDVLLRTN